MTSGHPPGAANLIGIARELSELHVATPWIAPLAVQGDRVIQRCARCCAASEGIEVAAALTGDDRAIEAYRDARIDFMSRHRACEPHAYHGASGAAILSIVCVALRGLRIDHLAETVGERSVAWDCLRCGRRHTEQATIAELGQLSSGYLPDAPRDAVMIRACREFAEVHAGCVPRSSAIRISIRIKN